VIQQTYTMNNVWQSNLFPYLFSFPDQFFPPVESTSGLELNLTQASLNQSEFFFQYYNVQKDHDDGFLGFGASTSTTETFAALENFYGQGRALSLNLLRYGWFQITLDLFPPPAFEPSALAAFLALPATWSPDNTTASNVAYGQFIQMYGTEVAIGALMGGLAKGLTWFAECFSLVYGNAWVTQESSDSYWGIYTDTNYNSQGSTGATEEWINWSSQTVTFYGGNVMLGPTDLDSWIKSIPTNPYPVFIKVVSLSDLFQQTDSVRATNLASATAAYLNSSYTQTAATAQSLVPPEQNPLPPSCKLS